MSEFVKKSDYYLLMKDRNERCQYIEELNATIAFNKSELIEKQKYILELERTIAALREEVERLKKLEAICHCGERVSAHNMGSGHSPVEMEEQCPYRSRLAEAEGNVEWLTDTLTTILWSYEQLRMTKG